MKSIMLSLYNCIPEKLFTQWHAGHFLSSGIPTGGSGSCVLKASSVVCVHQCVDQYLWLIPINTIINSQSLSQLTLSQHFNTWTTIGRCSAKRLLTPKHQTKISELWTAWWNANQVSNKGIDQRSTVDAWSSHVRRSLGDSKGQNKI